MSDFEWEPPLVGIPFWEEPTITGRIRAFLKEYGSITRQEMILCCGAKDQDDSVFRIIQSLRRQGWKIDCEFDNRREKKLGKEGSRWTVYNDEAEIGNIERYLQAATRISRQARAEEGGSQGGPDGPTDRPLANGREAGRTKHGD